MVACTSLRRFRKYALLFAAVFSFQYRTFAQERVFRSDIDDLLTVEKVTVLPFTDNLQGIYSRPLEAHFTQLVEKMHRWDYVPANTSGPILSPEELESSPDKAQTVGQGSDGFFACRIVKGPNGVTIHLSLFLSKDGKLLSQAILKDYKQFDIGDLKEQTERLLGEIVQRLPYAGRVLSREGNRVTVNLGLRDGVQNGQHLSIIQILQAHRHPKFNFLVRTEKEIFGKVKILKVDETLSFGVVVTEKEKGAIQKNSKVGSLDFVTYNTPENLSLTPSPQDALDQRDDSKIAFGKNAHAWSPASPPSFGQLGARLGLSRFNGAQQLTDGTAGMEGTNNFAPSIVIDGELWLTQEWTFAAKLQQGIISVGNPRSGGQPSTLNQALSYYEANAGYTIRLGPYIMSPNITPFFGYFSYRLYVDQSDLPAFTTQEYSGLKLGVRGTAPVGEDGWGMGASFSTAWNPSMRESPESSGASNKATVVQFGVLAYKKLSERLRLQADLDFEMYSASFSGTGTRAVSSSSASQRYTTLSAGAYYLF